MKAGYLFAIVILAAQSAAAENPDVYAGFGLGHAEHTLTDKTDIGFTIFAAVRLTDRIMLEGGPVWPGRIRDGEPVTKGFSIQAIGIFPIGEQFEFFAKGGFYDWEVDRREVRISDGRDPMFGIGLQRNMKNDRALRLGLDRFTDVRGGDINWISFSVIQKFHGMFN